MTPRAWRFAFLGLIAVCFAACESPLSPREIRALADAETRWAARGFRDYAIEMRQACFCAPEVNQWARVEVVAGIVNRVVVLETGAEMSPVQRSYFRTVEQVFSVIREAHNDDLVEDIVVAFDGQLGFPTYVGVVTKPDIVDGGGSHYLRNAGPIR